MRNLLLSIAVVCVLVSVVSCESPSGRRHREKVESINKAANDSVDYATRNNITYVTEVTVTGFSKNTYMCSKTRVFTNERYAAIGDKWCSSITNDMMSYNAEVDSVVISKNVIEVYR